MVAVMKVLVKDGETEWVMDYDVLVEQQQHRSAGGVATDGSFDFLLLAGTSALAGANTAALARLIEMLAEKGVLTLEEGLEVVDSSVCEISVADDVEG